MLELKINQGGTIKENILFLKKSFPESGRRTNKISLVRPPNTIKTQ